MTSTVLTAAQKQNHGPDVARIIDARHHDPFTILGRHGDGDAVHCRAFIPGAKTVTLVEAGQEMERLEGTDLFEFKGTADDVPEHYRLRWMDYLEKLTGGRAHAVTRLLPR